MWRFVGLVGRFGDMQSKLGRGQETLTQQRWVDLENCGQKLGGVRLPPGMLREDLRPTVWRKRSCSTIGRAWARRW